MAEATIRSIPVDRPKEAGKGMFAGKPSESRAVFAGAYERFPNTCGLGGTVIHPPYFPGNGARFLEIPSL